MKIDDSKPDVFFKADNSIWTDPYIQHNLLNAHLNPDSDAASRNEQSIGKTVDFISRQLKKTCSILDLGCGPGLYAQHLSRLQHKVTGIDFNRTAIQYAQAHCPDGYFIEGNYINNFPEGKYDAIIMIYCDMGTHSDKDRDVLLKACHRALNAGGKLIFDVFSEKAFLDKKEGKTWEFSGGAGFWHDQPHLVLKETFHYPENKAVAEQYHILSDETTRRFVIWERFYSKKEIAAVLENAGFKLSLINADLLQGNDFTSNHEMFIVAEK